MLFESITMLQAAKIFTYFSISFLVAFLAAPALIRTLIRLKFWKKTSRLQDSGGRELEITKNFYQETEMGRKVPRAGGILIWGTTLFMAVIFFILFRLNPDGDTTSTSFFEFLNFVDSTQTYIPLGVLLSAALLGLADDILVILPRGGNYFAGGLKLSHRMIGVSIISIFIGWWFHAKIGDKMHIITLPWWDSDIEGWFKLDLNSIKLPFGWLDNILASIGIEWNLAIGGWLIIPITMLVLAMLWGSSIIDGFDGIAAGTFIPIFLVFSGLAFAVKSYDIATLMAVITGAMMAYLWFNIPPAKFIMGDTGSLSLMLVLGAVAMLIDKLYVLPIAGLLLLATVGSAALQVFWKKVFKKKLFLAAPLHHHFEAKGMLRHEVTMKYWLISILCSVLAFAIGIIVS